MNQGTTHIRIDESTKQKVFHAEGIEKRYDSHIFQRGAVEVLSGVDLELSTSEIVGIVGENGSGKSTLLQILAGVLEPDAGDITRSGTIGWCPQEPLLYDRLTVKETFTLFGEAYGLSEKTIEQTTADLAERLGFEEYLDYRIEHLSGGNRQKVNLSVSLLHDPDLLLLDEPYTGFDWETYLSFWKLTEEIIESRTGIAIVSHLLNERERFDPIYELHDGTLTEEH